MKTTFAVALLAISMLCASVTAQENTAEDWYKKGRDLSRNGSYEEAVVAYDRAIEISPDNATLWAAKGNALSTGALFTNNQSRHNESLEAFDRALQIDSKNPRAWELKGLALSQMRRYNESLEAYDIAIENIDGYLGELPANRTEYLSGLLFYKGTNLWQVGRIEESLDAFDMAVSINPEEYDTWIMKGHLLAFLGRNDESLQALDRAAGIDGARPEMKASPWVLKGNALLVMGRYEEADGTYKNVTELNFSDESPGHYLSNAWRGRGIALAKLGMYNESIEAFNRSIEFDSKEYPRNVPIAWVGIGNDLRDMGRYEEAIRAYDRALEHPQFISAGIGHAWKGKGDALFRLGRGDDSIQAYGEAVKAYDEAVEAFDKAPELEKALSLTYDPYPLDGEFWYDRGYALWSLDRDSEANSAFEKARSLGYRAPGHASPTDSLSITSVTSLGEDEFIELTYTGNGTQRFKNLRLISENESIALPDFTLEQGEKIRMHLGSGATNRTDLFLDSEVALDDVSGSLRLKDLAAGVEKFMSYWTPGLAQENTAGCWIEKGNELYKNESYQEALNAYDEGLTMDPENASSWHYRGLALAGMGHGAEANQSIQKAMDLIDQRLREDPEDLEALWLRAEEMDLQGRSEEALEAYGRVAELNSTHALEAWIRESDIQAALGRYNQSVESFSRAMALVPAIKSESQLGFQRRSESTFIFTKAWLINGQIHRVSIGLYNISSKSFNEIEQINSDFVAALQLKGSVADAGRHYGYIMSSLNCDIYSFNVPKTLPPAWPSILTITRINPKGDDFIEVANYLKEAVSLQNWSLEIQGSRVSLPEYSLLPGKAVRVHLGSGQENGTDLFLDSGLELNDTAGSISLRDDSGAKVASLDYRTRLDGSIAHQVTHYPGTAESDLEYPEPGDDPFIAEGSGIGPKSAHDNHGDRDVLQEDTAEDWLKKGQELHINGSYEEAIQAYDKAIQIDPENAHAWVSRGHISSFMDKTDDARKEYAIALGILNQTLEENPQDASAWIEMGVVLSCLGRDAEAIGARENALEIYNRTLQKNPGNASAWETKALILTGMGRWEEAIEAYNEVIELSPAKAPGAWMGKAMLYSECLGMISESIDAWVMASELIPVDDIENQSTIWSGMAKSLSDAGRYEEALQAYEKAIELNPKDVHGWPNWSGKAYALYMLGRYNECIEASDTVIEMLPKHPDIYVWKGNSLYHLGRYKEAIEAYEKAIEFNPKDGAAWMGKGRIFYDNGRYEEAVEAYEKAIEFAPFNVTPVLDLYAMNLSATAWASKGEALKALGRQAEADEAYAKAKEIGYRE